MRKQSKLGVVALLFVAVFAFSWLFVVSAVADDGPPCYQSLDHPHCGTCSFCQDGTGKKWCNGGVNPPCVPNACIQLECYVP